jgi:hypothetical protein
MGMEMEMVPECGYTVRPRKSTIANFSKTKQQMAQEFLQPILQFPRFLIRLHKTQPLLVVEAFLLIRHFQFLAAQYPTFFLKIFILRVLKRTKIEIFL